jgi:sortase A
MISQRNQVKIIYTIAVLVGMASIFALLYPWISNSWNQFAASQLIVDYSQQEFVNIGESLDYSGVLQDAMRYNEELYAAGNNHIPEYLERAGMATESELSMKLNYPDAYYESFLSFNDYGMMGYITIPKINVLLPIRHYATTEVLATSVGHIYGSSLPVGGESTHSVLTAHSALMTAKLFTDLEKLEIRDAMPIYLCFLKPKRLIKWKH